jgi:hypothetical protein
MNSNAPVNAALGAVTKALNNLPANAPPSVVDALNAAQDNVTTAVNEMGPENLMGPETLTGGSRKKKTKSKSKNKSKEKSRQKQRSRSKSKTKSKQKSRS